MEAGQLITRTFNLKFGNINISPQYWQAGLIVFLLFLLLLSLARLRYLYVHWALGKSAVAMMFWGFALTLILEGFLLVGGRTLLTEILGWKNAPKPISTALDAGRDKLVKVLGVTEEVPESVASEKPTYQSVVENFQSLSPNEAEQARLIICQP